MSTPNGRKNIVRLRTFADDAERARQATGSTEHVDAEISPEDMLPEDKSVFHKVKKKDLKLKDEESAPSAIDAEGVSFDKKTATNVVDQAYEEGRAVIKNTKEQAAAEIPKNVAASVIKQPPVAPKPPIAKTPSSTVPKPPTKQPDEITEASEYFEETIEDTTAPTEGISQGEFVRDTKRDRFKLIPAIGEAMTGWFIETKEQIEEAGREKHTVSKVENRVETIKKAARPETLAPDADFDQVAERLKKVERRNVDTPVVVKPKDKEAPAQWSYLTDEENQENKIDEVVAEVVPQTQEHSVEKVKESQTEVKPLTFTETKIEKPVTPIVEVEPEITSQETLISAQPVTPEPEPVAEPPAVTQPEASTPPAATPITDEYLNQQPEVAEDTTSTTEVTTPTPETVPVTQAEPAQTISPAPQPAFEATPTETVSQAKPAKTAREFLPSPLIAIIVVLFAILAGVGTSIYFFWQPPQGAVTIDEPQPTTKPLFTAELQTSIPYGDSHTDTMSTMLAAINSDPSTLYLYLVDPQTEEPLPPNEVMSHMAPQAPGAFSRSVTNISFGALNNRPFIMLRTNNFDAAFSGMLAWEQTMSADLAPLFGSVVTETYDPQARTDSQTRSAYFKDVVSNNLSSRLLSDEVGKDRIMYTFVNKQTVLIVTDRLQLNEIVPLIR